MNKLDITKKVVSAVIGLGTSKIAHSIIKNNVQPENVIDKVTVPSAAVVIGMMASQATKEFTGKQIDELVATWQNAKQKIEEAKKESK